MDQKIESLKEQLNIHKKNLTDLEVEKAHFGLEVRTHTRRQIEHEKEELRRVEAEIRKINNSLVQKVNEIRTRTIAALSEYNQLSSVMSDFENMFLGYVLLPGNQLQLTIQKRRFLEREYNRIREAIEKGTYINQGEVENDVRQTLKHAEVEYAYKESEQTDESRKAMSLTAVLEPVEPATVIDEKKKKKLVKEFRTVIMKVHPDTCEGPFDVEVFNSVYEVYRKRDYLLMEAFIIQYRGELSSKVGEDTLIFLDLVTTYSREYPSVLERLEKRIEKLKQDMTVKEIENPEEIQIQMKKQNREIRKVIYEEAEQILHLRSCLEDLAQLPLRNKGGDER